MLKPICVPCQRFYRRKKSGVGVIEAMPKPGTYENGPPPAGKDHGDLWQPYKLWHADLWVCHGCGAEMITGSGRLPLCEHYMPDFAQMVERFPPIVTVNDC